MKKVLYEKKLLLDEEKNIVENHEQLKIIEESLESH
jgi:hypothetical protein